MFLRAKYKIRYYKNRLFHLIGLCPVCYSKVNYTRNGRAICPRGCRC